MRFRDWPIVIKLMVTPALIVFVVFIAAYGSYKLTELRSQEHAERVSALMQREQSFIRLRASMAEADLVLFRAIMSDVRNHTNIEQKFLKEGAFHRLDEVDRQAHFDQDGTPLFPQEQIFLKSIRDAVGDYVKAAKAHLENDVRGGFDKSDSLESISAYSVAVDSAITAWEVYKTAAFNQMEKMSRDDRAETMLWFSGFVGVFVVVAFGFTMMVSRYISAPIQNVVDIMHNLADGNHEVKLTDVDRRDEVGQMIMSISTFQARLKFLNDQAEQHIQEQSQAQKDLQSQLERVAASEQRLRDIAESTSDWFWETDADDRLTMVSQRFYDVTGLSPKQVIGVARLDFAKPAKTQEDASHWVEYAKIISLRKSFKNLVYRVQGGDGHEVSIRSSGTPFFDKYGEFQGYRGASTDITDLVRTQEKLENSRNHLLGITSSLFEGVMLLAMDGTVLFANPSAHKLLQIHENKLPGMHIDEVLKLIIVGRDVDYIKGPLHRVFAVQDTIVDENAKFRLVTSNDSLSVAYACAVITKDGGPPSAVVSFRSIEALKHAQSEALQSSRLASVGQLAAGIAHEINTPIQYVGDNIRFFDSSFSTLEQLLKDIQNSVADETVPAPVKEKIHTIIEDADAEYLMEELPDAARQSLDGVEHVAKIVRSMKEFSHPGSGVSKVMTDINRTIESTLIVSTNEWKHNAVVEKKLASDLPHVLCLPAEINQVLLNIIVNASHALEGRTPKGLIQISTLRDGDEVEIRIADNGAGIPEDIREHIFDPFFTTKAVGKGTGQGLAISMDVVVTKHGGQLLYEDTPGGGATFVIRLPIGEEKKTEQGAKG